MNVSKKHIATRLAKLLETANTAAAVGDDELGRCDFIDPDGNPQCRNFTEHQCSEVGGNWDASQRC
jgi:hypothetical protein